MPDMWQDGPIAAGTAQAREKLQVRVTDRIIRVRGNATLRSCGRTRGLSLVRAWERRVRMQVKEIMTQGVDTIAPDATIQEAAQKMEQLDIGPVPVCDGERLMGMLTDRDITV